MNTYDKIREALKEAKEKPYTNGMATQSVDIKTELGDISVIRKCGDTQKPEIFLLFLKPNEELGHLEPNTGRISKIIMDILGLKHTDLNLVPKPRHGYEHEYICIFPVSLL